MRQVYLLWHCHELRDDLGVHDEEKLIGVFSRRKKAREAIELLKSKDGFKDYPLECFEIHKTVIDGINWIDGFCTVYWSE